MFDRLKAHARTATARQSALTSVSTLANGFLGALFYFLLARLLGAFDYGVFSVIVTTMITLAAVFDFGSDQSLIMFVPKFPAPEFFPYAKLALLVKLASSLVIFLAFYFFSTPIAGSVFHQPSLSAALPLVGIGVFTQLLFSFSTSLAQAQQKYLLWGGLFVGTNFFRLLFLFLLYFSAHLHSLSVIFIYLLFPFLGFLFYVLVTRLHFGRARITGAVVRRFFSFNKWVVGFTLLSAVASRLDVFFTARYANLVAVGVYSLAGQIATIMPQLTSAIGAVTAPKFSSFTSSRQTSVYTGKTALLSFGVAVISALVLIPLSLVVFSFSGKSYSAGFGPFLLLLLSLAIFLITAPVRDGLLYYYARPQIFFYTAVLQILVSCLASPVFILRYSIAGAAFVVLLNTLLTTVIYLVFYFRLKETS